MFGEASAPVLSIIIIILAGSNILLTRTHQRINRSQQRLLKTSDVLVKALETELAAKNNLISVLEEHARVHTQLLDAMQLNAAPRVPPVVQSDPTGHGFFEFGKFIAGTDPYHGDGVALNAAEHPTGPDAAAIEEADLNPASLETGELDLETGKITFPSSTEARFRDPNEWYLPPAAAEGIEMFQRPRDPRLTAAIKSTNDAWARYALNPAEDTELTRIQAYGWKDREHLAEARRRGWECNNPNCPACEARCRSLAIQRGEQLAGSVPIGGINIVGGAGGNAQGSVFLLDEQGKKLGPKS